MQQYYTYSPKCEGTLGIGGTHCLVSHSTVDDKNRKGRGRSYRDTMDGYDTTRHPDTERALILYESLDRQGERDYTRQYAGKVVEFTYD